MLLRLPLVVGPLRGSRCQPRRGDAQLFAQAMLRSRLPDCQHTGCVARQQLHHELVPQGGCKRMVGQVAGDVEGPHGLAQHLQVCSHGAALPEQVVWNGGTVAVAAAGQQLWVDRADGLQHPAQHPPKGVVERVRCVRGRAQQRAKPSLLPRRMRHASSQAQQRKLRIQVVAGHRCWGPWPRVPAVRVRRPRDAMELGDWHGSALGCHIGPVRLQHLRQARCRGVGIPEIEPQGPAPIHRLAPHSFSYLSS
mmetsp:Transcript_18617/g.47692  ORF Transcript_18617/g.47692 Transcript_18617/m.47692 type:complete len:251 (+) Transcript_18617:1927-2679(+)